MTTTYEFEKMERKDGLIFMTVNAVTTKRRWFRKDQKHAEYRYFTSEGGMVWYERDRCSDKLSTVTSCGYWINSMLSDMYDEQRVKKRILDHSNPNQE